MQLTCPQCNQPVEADNINIQQLVALCPACSAVFEFSMPRARNKPKRRKVQRPEHLRVEETDRLQLAFRTNFRLDKDENFINSATLSAAFSFVAVLMIALNLEGEGPLILPLLFSLLSALAWFWLATLTYNKTHIVMGEECIQVSRQPLPSLGKTRTITLSGIDSISAEETTASQEQGYDTPRYHVWANAIDESRKLIVGDVTENYALYIAGRLDEYLHRDEIAEVGRLELDKPSDEQQVIASDIDLAIQEDERDPRMLSQ